MATYDDIAERVRQRTGDAPADRMRFVALVDMALSKLSEMCADSPTREHYVLSEQSATTATTNADGQADLTALLTTPPKLILGKVTQGQIYDSNNPLQPLQWRKNEYLQMMSCVDVGTSFGGVVLNKRTLTAYDEDGEPLANTALQVNCATLLDLETLALELETDLTTQVIALLPAAPPLASRYADAASK